MSSVLLLDNDLERATIKHIINMGYECPIYIQINDPDNFGNILARIHTYDSTGVRFQIKLTLDKDGKVIDKPAIEKHDSP